MRRKGRFWAILLAFSYSVQTSVHTDLRYRQFSLKRLGKNFTHTTALKLLIALEDFNTALYIHRRFNLH